MIDVVMITTGRRPELFNQSMRSLKVNKVMDGHALTVVLDGKSDIRMLGADTWILNAQSVGASASRNIGASSIPKYRRGSHVMFLDDDVYLTKGWDAKMLELAEYCDRSLISGHAHPFNHASVCRFNDYAIAGVPLVFGAPLVISSVCMLMPWSLWDDVGYFAEPGGPGGSEDYDYCMRAKAKGYGFAVTYEQCVLHTGLTSSSGKPIVGADQVRENNAKLEIVHGIEGKVIYL